MKQDLSIYYEKLSLFADQLHRKLSQAKIPEEKQKSSISITELTGPEALVIIEVLRFGIHSAIESYDLDGRSSRLKNVVLSSFKKLSEGITVDIAIEGQGDMMTLKGKHNTFNDFIGH